MALIIDPYSAWRQTWVIETGNERLKVRVYTRQRGSADADCAPLPLPSTPSIPPPAAWHKRELYLSQTNTARLHAIMI